jgi:hypothetical protein
MRSFGFGHNKSQSFETCALPEGSGFPDSRKQKTPFSAVLAAAFVVFQNFTGFHEKSAVTSEPGFDAGRFIRQD